jgi:lipopolysaccharide transport system permease protein
VRYKQTALGVAWAVLQPVLTMIVFSIVFGRLAKVPSNGVPYPVFSYAGLLPWTFFAAALAQGSTSLATNANLISKVYFPRLVLPMAVVLAGTLDFSIAFLVLIAMMLFYGIVPGLAILTIPFFLALAVMTALGVSLWLSALDVKYRDVRYAIPFLAQFWLFATPVAYPTSLIPASWQLVYGLNPMAGVVEGFRWALLGEKSAPGGTMAVSVLIALLVFGSGLFYFRRLERQFADVV